MGIWAALVRVHNRLDYVLEEKHTGENVLCWPFMKDLNQKSLLTPGVGTVSSRHTPPAANEHAPCKDEFLLTVKAAYELFLFTFLSAFNPYCPHSDYAKGLVGVFHHS